MIHSFPDVGGLVCLALVPQHSTYDGTSHQGFDEKYSSFSTEAKPSLAQSIGLKTTD